MKLWTHLCVRGWLSVTPWLNSTVHIATWMQANILFCVIMDHLNKQPLFWELHYGHLVVSVSHIRGVEQPEEVDIVVGKTDQYQVDAIMAYRGNSMGFLFTVDPWQKPG